MPGLQQVHGGVHGVFGGLLFAGGGVHISSPARHKLRILHEFVLQFVPGGLLPVPVRVPRGERLVRGVRLREVGVPHVQKRKAALHQRLYLIKYE